MKFNLCPEYLSSLVPQTVSSISRYNLRNANDLQTIKTESTLYYNSFLPSTVRAWNNLPNEAKHLQSTDAFKYYLKRTIYKSLRQTQRSNLTYSIKN